MKPVPVLVFCAVLFVGVLPGARAEGELGLFADQGDVGTVSKAGTGVYDPAQNTYVIGASGLNMWFKADAMHYLWKQASGDVAVAADIAFIGRSNQAHRKACLVLRQSLEPGSPYVDVAQHGNGLTSLQFRLQPDGITQEIESNLTRPSRVRIDKIGDDFYLSVAQVGEEVKPSGASVKLHLRSPFYVGLAVCAHDDTAFETAVFAKVTVGSASRKATVPQPGLKIITLPSGDRRVSDQ